MKCICSDRDNANPCPIHKNKLPRPEFSCNEMYVVRVYRRSSNLKWFYTVSKDAVRLFMSQDLDAKPKIEVTSK